MTELVALDGADGQQPLLGVDDRADVLARDHLQAGRAVDQHDEWLGLGRA
jgi:hypothetical protein